MLTGISATTAPGLRPARRAAVNRALAPAVHPQAAEPVEVGQVAGDEQHVGIGTRSSGLGDDVRVEQEVDHQGGTRPVNAGSGAGLGGTAGQGRPVHRGARRRAAQMLCASWPSRCRSGRWPT